MTGRRAKGDLEPIERASERRAAGVATRASEVVLRHAYENVAHYRRLRRGRRAPGRSTALEDLGRFPFLTKQDFRANYPFGMFAVPREQIVRIHASSGTTGKPTVVGYTATDIDTWAEARRALDPRRGRSAPATSSTSHTATDCSPAGSARTTAPKSSAAR